MENILYVIGGLVLLVLGGEFLVRASVGLSFKLNISKMVIGLTVVSFATSAPELLVSINAAINDSPAIAINNVIGSNIANIGLVLGITAIIGPLAVNKTFYRLTWPSLLVFSLLIYLFLWTDALLARWEGIVLVVGLISFLVILIRSARKDAAAIDIEEVDDMATTISYAKIFLWLVLGGAALYYGSEFLVDGAKAVAQNLGVSEGVISITMIAIGTSVPELAASVIAAIKKEKAISLGNLIGSNIFNIASVLGITSIITEIEIPAEETQILTNDIFWMLGFTVILLPFTLLPKKSQIDRYQGVFLFLVYVFFIYLVF